MKWMRRAKKRREREKERVGIERGESREKNEGGREATGMGGGERGRAVKHEERVRLLREWQRDRRGKRKRTWRGREAR